MDTVQEIRKWAYLEAKEKLPAATIKERIAAAKELEEYLDLTKNPDPKTLPSANTTTG